LITSREQLLFQRHHPFSLFIPGFLKLFLAFDKTSRSHEVNGIKIDQQVENLAHLVRDIDVVLGGLIRLDGLVDVHEDGEAAEKVLDEGHEEGGEVRELRIFIHRPLVHVLQRIETHHRCIGHVGYLPCCVV
jgi:hypothetical protein